MTDWQFHQHISDIMISLCCARQTCFRLRGAHRCSLHCGSRRIDNGTANTSCNLLGCGAQTKKHCQQGPDRASEKSHMLLSFSPVNHSRPKLGGKIPCIADAQMGDTTAAAVLWMRFKYSGIGYPQNE